MKTILLIVGLILTVAGSFWALQGAGIVQWPADSFMISDPHWTYYGVATAIVGLGLIWFSRR